MALGRALPPAVLRQRQGIGQKPKREANGTRAFDQGSIARMFGGATRPAADPTRRPRRQDRAWQRVQAERLRIEPSCRTCRAEGKITPATEVDHVVPISEGGALLDLANTQSLCAEHHADKSAADRARRTGRPVRRRRRYGVDAATGRPLDPNHWWNAGK